MGGGLFWLSRPLAILGIALVAACGPSGNDPGPGAVTVDEARALDDAAEMLEERRIPADVLAEEGQPEGESVQETEQEGASE